MYRLVLPVATLALILPAPSHAVSASQCSAGMDIESADLVPGSLNYTHGGPDMVDVIGSLGQYGPFEGSTMCLLSTGDPSNITQGQDYDWPGNGADTSVGDRIEITFDLTVPPWAYSFFFRHDFFSREYPEWVGSAFNDTLQINLTGAAWSGQIAFDAAGNPIDVNNGFFVVTDPVDLAGTGFDQDGSTGWLVSIAPVLPNDVITLSFTVYDVADGVWDSAVLLDDFEWSSSQITMPYTDFADPEGGFTTPPPGWNEDPPEPTVAYLSPKESPLAGGGEVTLVGTDLWADAEVWIGEARAVVTAIGPTAVDLIVPSASAAGVPDGGPTDVRLVVGGVEAVLASGFDYHPAAGDADGPTARIDLVWPLSITPDRARSLEIIGPGLRGGRPELELLDGSVIPLEVLASVSTPLADELTVAVPPLQEGMAIVRVHTKGSSAGWGQYLPIEPEPGAEALPSGCSVAPGVPGLFTLLGLLALLRRRVA